MPAQQEATSTLEHMRRLPVGTSARAPQLGRTSPDIDNRHLVVVRGDINDVIVSAGMRVRQKRADINDETAVQIEHD